MRRVVSGLRAPRLAWWRPRAPPAPPRSAGANLHPGGQYVRHHHGLWACRRPGRTDADQGRPRGDHHGRRVVGVQPSGTGLQGNDHPRRRHRPGGAQASRHRARRRLPGCHPGRQPQHYVESDCPTRVRHQARGDPHLRSAALGYVRCAGPAGHQPNHHWRQRVLRAAHRRAGPGADRLAMYAIIAGGGKVGFFLARELIEQGHEILIIENNSERAEFIANELGNVVLRGNADEASTLAEAGAERADVIIAVTGDDPRNLVLLQVAKRRFGTRRTIARINDPRNESLFRMLGIDATVNATQVMLSVLEQEIPHANLVPLLRLRNTDVEVVEAVVDPRSRVTGSTLREVDLPPESTIAVVIRNGSAFFPNGATVLEPGDEVVALTRGIHEPRLRSLFFSERYTRRRRLASRARRPAHQFL